MRTVVAAAVLVLMAGSAWAESTEADWQKYAQPLVDVYARCGRAEVDRLWKTSMTPEEIADSAAVTCETDLEALRPVLVKPPFNGDAERIKATFDVLTSEARSVIVADVEKRRKE